MAFQKYQKPKYPVRQWLLEGPAKSGKSTFITQLRTPLLPIDADHRFAEVADLVPEGDVLQLSSNPADHVNPDRIAELLRQNMPGSTVGTIVVDSLSPIIVPLIMMALRDNDAGKNRNKVAAFKDKATAVRLLQDSITGWGSDVAWIYHTFEGRDARAQEEVKTSLPELEIARVLRSCNMRLRFSNEGGVYKVRVVWARRGRSGVELADDTGCWTGMPEKIEAAVYDGLSEAQMDTIESQAPDMFPSPAEAIRWGMDQDGVFRDEAHAQNAYDLVKDAKQPTGARQMRDLWVAEVEARKNGESTVTEEERHAIREAES